MKYITARRRAAVVVRVLEGRLFCSHIYFLILPELYSLILSDR